METHTFVFTSGCKQDSEWFSNQVFLRMGMKNCPDANLDMLGYPNRV